MAAATITTAAQVAVVTRTSHITAAAACCHKISVVVDAKSRGNLAAMGEHFAVAVVVGHSICLVATATTKTVKLLMGAGVHNCHDRRHYHQNEDVARVAMVAGTQNHSVPSCQRRAASKQMVAGCVAVAAGAKTVDAGTDCHADNLALAVATDRIDRTAAAVMGAYTNHQSATAGTTARLETLAVASAAWQLAAKLVVVRDC